MPKKLALFALLAALGCTGAPLGERTINISLGYQDRSTVGPVTARGVMQIETRAGTVSLEVTGLDETDTSQRFEAWLAGGGECALSVGRMEIGADGGQMLATTLGNISERTFDRVELTLEDEPDDSTEPSVRISIGGEIE